MACLATWLPWMDLNVTYFESSFRYGDDGTLVDLSGDGNNDGIPDAIDLFLRIDISDDDDYKFIGIDFDEPLQDLSSIEVQNLLNHFTIRSNGNALPVSAFSRIETGATENDGDSNDWLDIVFADNFDTDSLSENLTIEYDGEGGLLGLNGDPAPSFSSALRIDDGGEDSDYEEGNNDGIPDATDIFLQIDPSGDDDYKFIGIDFDEPLQDLSSTEVQNLSNHFTIRSDGNALPLSAFSRIETGATENDGDSNDWLDIVFADNFDTDSLSENLTIEYDGEGGLLGLNGDPARSFSSALRIDDGGEDSDYEEGNNDGIPDATDIFLQIDPSGDDDYKFIGIDFDEPLQDLSSIEVQNLLNHFTIRSDGNALPVSAFSRIETGATENDGDSNDWLDIVFADNFDTDSLSENLTIEYDGEGGLLGLNGDPAPAFSSELRVRMMAMKILFLIKLAQIRLHLYLSL